MKCAALLILASVLILVLLFASPNASPAQNSAAIAYGQLALKDKPSQFWPEQTVVKIATIRINPKESLKRIGLAIISSTATGWCLGQGRCDFILTNYHVAERVGSPLKIKGVKVLQTYEATSPQDEGAIWEKSPLGFSVKLVPVRDIAIFRLEVPLKGMYGIPFSPHQLSEGENVKIYGRPGGRKITVASATFDMEAKDGVLLFKVKPGDEKILIPGISGSLVVNERNEAVGLVQGIASDNMLAVVPVWSLAEFAKKIKLDRYQETFPFSDQALYRPDNSELVPVDLLAESQAFARDIGPEDGLSPPSAVPEEYLWFNLDKPTPRPAAAVVGAHLRIEEPPNVQALRQNAEDMVERINDLLAVGKQRSMGGRTPEVTTQYRLRMLSGHQTFTMDGKEVPQLPCPEGNGLGISTAWADFPTMVGDNLKLRIQQVDDLSLPGWGSVKVFRYEAAAEDKVAKIDYCTSFGFHIHTEKIVSVPVRGEVWTDDALNILRITQELLAPPAMGWLDLRSSVLYGWLDSPNGERKLVPTNIFSRGELTDDHQIYSTLCRITDYHRFAVSVLVGSQITQSIP